PGNLELAHHAVVYIVDRQRALDMQAADYLTPGVDDGWDSYGGSGVGGFVLQGWAPGANSVQLLNEGLGVALRADQAIVLQMHYNNVNGPSMSDRTKIGLKLSSDPNILLVRNTIPTVLPGWSSPAIEGPALDRNGPCTADVIGPGPCFGPGCGDQLPGETNVYEMTINVPSDTHLVSVFPHMHQLGDKFVVSATLPDSTVVPIIRLDEWDFDWQLSYNFKKPIALPAGSVVTVTGTYFNATSEPVCGGLFSYESMLTFGNSITIDSEGIPTPRDSTPPRVLSVTADEVDSGLTLVVTFDEEIVLPHYPSAVEIIGSSGGIVAPDSMTVTGDSLIIEYLETPQGSSSDYQLLLRGFFGIKDSNGNFLDGNANGVGGELIDDSVYAFEWSTRSSETSESGDGACFIATAAYGTPMAEEINTLRAVRDTYMLNNVVGTVFVDLYYRLSPPIANKISTIPALGAGVRLLLIPILLLATVLLTWPMLVPLFVTAALGATVLCRRRRHS
ncbi:MAG: CFI-box-CTERM domain-containing protein, partial [Candidatus Hydrogenedentota bacterium]